MIQNLLSLSSRSRLISLALCLTIPLTVLFSENIDSIIGKKAPIIAGKKAIGDGMLKLNQLMRKVGYKKDAAGKFVEVNGKFVLGIEKYVVVLNFFSTTCIPCVREIPTYNQVAQKYRNKPVKMIYVNIDIDETLQEIARFIANKQIKVPMMVPNRIEAMKLYQVYALPRMVVIDKKGIITHVISGFNENLKTELSEILDHLIQ